LADLDPPEFEIRGFSAADFSGKVCVTGGHMRPKILEQIGNDVAAHPMGIKVPLIAPDVTIGEGSFTGQIQVAFQRVREVGENIYQRSDISPIWPDTGAENSGPVDKSWGSMIGFPVFLLGAQFPE